jgi:peptidoglycan/LPS O-acetylase OafA/YrhL
VSTEAVATIATETEAFRGSPSAVSGPGAVPDGAGGGTGRGHLHAVDVVRFLTLLGVIVVHSTSLTDPDGTAATGAVLVVLHVTREVFLFLSAFVLAYSYRSRPATVRTFWRRRYPLVVVPYAVWSAVYLLTDGRIASPAHLVTTYLVDLVDGGAHFHLYFLLLTFQLYLVFPALLAFLARRPRLHVPLLVSSVAFELGFSGAVHYGWRPPVLRYWFDHPGSWLPSYELYVVAGILAALHLDAVTAWVRRHQRGIALGFAISIVFGLGSYVMDLTVLGYGPLHASEVFQPAVVVEAAGAVLAQYALGLWISDRLGARRLRQLERSSDVSFGVYLAHPLHLAGVLEVAGAAGVSATVGRLPSGIVEILVVMGLVPLVYLATAGAMLALRRTPLSLALSGRRRPASTSPAPKIPATKGLS